jgi:hypothetical protein
MGPDGRLCGRRQARVFDFIGRKVDFRSAAGAWHGRSPVIHSDQRLRAALGAGDRKLSRLNYLSFWCHGASNAKT